MSFWEGKRVLVTGGAGFIGSHVVDLLLAAGRKVEITAADDLSSGRRENLPKAPGARLKVADLRDPKACCKACKGQDVVLHLAARVGGIAYNLAHPGSMFRDNMTLAGNMLEAARLARVERFVVVSSACVYPRFCTVPTPETEGFSGWPEPTNEGYGWAKRMLEFQAMSYHKEFGMKFALARPYNTYGPRDHFELENCHVIPALIRRVLSGEDPVRVWGDGKQTRAFLYVEDAARGLLETAERWAECDPVNLGSEEEITIAELLRMILELCGRKPKVEFDASKPSGQPRRNCDTSKALEKVGFKARFSLREGLARTIDWWRKQGERP
ncbi:MAG: NAD-dependent epimerase/dehydratase family protein [Elusimicrobia bacterium]|nr:NAD-dependent epimerase/dehydratase family protein [Elusimicrobiota bacterium]